MRAAAGGATSVHLTRLPAVRVAGRSTQEIAFKERFGSRTGGHPRGGRNVLVANPSFSQNPPTSMAVAQSRRQTQPPTSSFAPAIRCTFTKPGGSIDVR